MHNNIQVTIKSSTAEMSLNNHEAGIYIVPELEGLTGLPEIRTTSGVNAGYDGGWTSAQNFDARLITLRGVIANEDKSAVERMRRQLVALLAQGKNEQLTFDIVTEAGSAYELQVRTIACEMAMQKVLTQQQFLIQLRADDPLIYDNETSGESVIVRVQQALGGFQIPFELPLIIGGAEDAGLIDNSGLESVYPIIKMYGALHNPKIVNQSTNQFMQLNTELGFAEGEPIDPKNVSGKSISFDDSAAGTPLGNLSLLGDTFQETTSGKNLADFVVGTSDLNGLTPSYNATTGEISVTGTATSTYSNLSAWVNATIPAGNYTFSIENATSLGRICIRISDGTTSHDYAIAKNATSCQISTNYIGTRYRIFLDQLTSGTSINLKIKAQLESGTSKTSFEPYTAGASPNPDYPQTVQTVTGGQNIEVHGKNLFNKFAPLEARYIDGSGNWAGGAASFVNQEYVIAGDSTISFSFAERVGTPNVRVAQYKADGTFIRRDLITTNTYIRTNAQTVKVIFSTENNTTTYFRDLQIELGSTATAYEPYQGQSYEINLGKNLFNGSIVEDKVIGSNGAETTLVDFCITNAISVEPNTTYTASAKSNGDTSKDHYCRVAYYDSNMTFISRPSILFPHTFTTPSNAKFVKLSYEFKANTEVQLEKGSQATPYAPYIQSFGKNMFDISKSNINYYLNQTTGALDVDTGALSNTSDFIKVEPNTTYTITSGTNGYKRVCEYTSADQTKFIRAQGTAEGSASYTFTTSATCQYIRFQYRKQYTNVQLEQGSQPTTYEPFFNGELCKLGDYQDRIYKQNGKWYVEKKVGKTTFDGTENWLQSGATSASVMVSALTVSNLGISNAGRTLAVSDRFTYNYNNALPNVFALYNPSGDVIASLSFGFNKTLVADLASAKTWLGANKPTVYYALATPTISEITYQPLVEQLNGLLDTARTLEGDNFIESSSVYLPAFMDVTYFTGKNPDRRDELIIDSRLRTVTLNGLDIYHLRAEGSEFPLLQPGQNKFFLQSDNVGDNGYAEVNYKQGYLSI